MDDVKTGARWPEEPVELSGAGLPGLAHDLNSWLTPVKTCLQLWEAGEVEKAAALRPTAVQNLNTVFRCLEALCQRPTSAPAPMPPVKIRALLEQVLADCQALASEKQVCVDLVSADETVVPGDEMLLRRLFLNLLTNALHAAPPASRVQVKTAVPPTAGVEILFTNACRATVADTNEERLNKGLGLRISREICRLHQGTLDLRCDEKNQIITAVVTLPASTPTPA